MLEVKIKISSFPTQEFVGLGLVAGGNPSSTLEHWI
jgi:hypothetical protein